MDNLFRNADIHHNQILSLQLHKSHVGCLSQADHSLLLQLLCNYNQNLSMQEFFWHKKSCIRWLREGDINTFFFYKATIIRRCHNRILSLKDESGHWVFDENIIRQNLLQFFNLIGQTINLLMTLGFQPFLIFYIKLRRILLRHRFRRKG